MNKLSALETTANRYLVMRHGNSLANQQGIIVSHPENGCHGFGLSETGRLQVQATVENDTLLDARTLIFSSDFVRALESAEVVARLLGCEQAVTIDIRLRERNFGELELGPDNAYDAVWRQDAESADSSYRSTESANQVMARVSELIVDLERRYSERTILLVSHGDALQMLQTAFMGQPASAHRQIPHLQTAEIRPMLLHQ